MKNREKIAALKKAQSCYEDISNLLKEIIENTFDYHCDMIYNFNICDDIIYVYYEYCCRGEYGRGEVHIPIAWLDEGFDYMEAYKEMLRQEDLARIRKEEEEKKRRKELRKAQAKQREEREYKKYLALKKKYEGSEKMKTKIDLTKVSAVCHECATRIGRKPKNKVCGVWIDTCGICKEEKPCTDLWHDWIVPMKGETK